MALLYFYNISPLFNLSLVKNNYYGGYDPRGKKCGRRKLLGEGRGGGEGECIQYRLLLFRFL